MEDKDYILNNVNKKNVLNKTGKLLFFIFFSLIIIICSILCFYYLYQIKNLINKNKIEKSFNIETNFNYSDYERNIITKKIIKKAGFQLSLKQVYFINGILRYYRPKKCLEVGVANGGSSIIILNAIKDIKNSFLISLDLNTQLYLNTNLKTGFRVQKFFPELTKTWKLLTGDLPHKFLTKLNETFDFIFLDTTHMAPGEILNFIEVLPFLKEKAIMIIHDTLWHFSEKIKFYPSNIYLFPNIRGKKILLKNNKGIDNIGGVILYPNQRKYYLDYFLILLCFWEYIPTDNQLNDMRKFIKKYYNNNLYLQIFNLAVRYNQFAVEKHNSFLNLFNNSKYKSMMKTLGNNLKKYTNLTSNKNR